MSDAVTTRAARFRGPVQAAGAMFLVGTLAGVSGLIEDYPIYGGQALRYLLAAAILLAAVRLSGLRFVRPSPREAVLLAALALTGLAVFNVCVIEATRHGGPALVGTVLGTVPLALALIGGRPSARMLGAAAVVVAGATVATGLGSGEPAGLLWSLGALACEVCFSVLAIPLLPRLGALRVSAYSSALAVPLLGVIGLLSDGAAALRAPTAAEAAGLGYQAVVVTAVAFFLWYDALPRLGAAKAGLFAGLIPVGAMTTGAILGLGAPSAADLAGAALVIAGIAVGLTAGSGRTARSDHTAKSGHTAESRHATEGGHATGSGQTTESGQEEAVPCRPGTAVTVADRA